MNKTIKCIEMWKTTLIPHTMLDFFHQHYEHDHDVFLAGSSEMMFYDQSLNNTSELCDMKVILYFIEGVELNV